MTMRRKSWSLLCKMTKLELQKPAYLFKATLVLTIILFANPATMGNTQYIGCYPDFSPKHTGCLQKSECPTGSRSGVSEEEKALILRLHNDLRARVALGGGSTIDQPRSSYTASNMRQLAWDGELAFLAQKWAEQCNNNSESDCQECRKVDRFDVGQNIWYQEIEVGEGVQPLDANWTKAIETWTQEGKYVDVFKDILADFYETLDRSTASYIQMIWASSYLIGCGFVHAIRSKDQASLSIYVCNFGPKGNNLGNPVFVNGPPCGSCPASANVCIDHALCSGVSVPSRDPGGLVLKALPANTKINNAQDKCPYECVSSLDLCDPATIQSRDVSVCDMGKVCCSKRIIGTPTTPQGVCEGDFSCVASDKLAEKCEMNRRPTFTAKCPSNTICCRVKKEVPCPASTHFCLPAKAKTFCKPETIVSNAIGCKDTDNQVCCTLTDTCPAALVSSTTPTSTTLASRCKYSCVSGDTAELCNFMKIAVGDMLCPSVEQICCKTEALKFSVALGIGIDAGTTEPSIACPALPGIAHGSFKILSCSKEKAIVGLNLLSIQLNKTECVQGSGLKSKTLIQYTCDKFYVLRGNEYQTCGDTGSWQGNIPICEAECGRVQIATSPLIAKGKKATPGQFPWMAALFSSSYTSRGAICGGALIKESWVLTASHCVVSDANGEQTAAEELIVYLGKFRRSLDEDDISAVQRKEVSKVVRHEDFSFKTMGSDIALLMLKSPVVLNERVQLICLPLEYESTADKLADGNRGTVAGWGLNESNEQAEELTFAELTVISNDKCREITVKTTSDPSTVATMLTPSKFCAGDGIDTPADKYQTVCEGDSGSPLVFIRNDSADATWSVEGIVSFYFPGRKASCRDRLPGMYSVFTKVFWYRDWIRMNMIPDG